MLQKIRVHEVAKDLKLKSTELLDMFTQHGITLKNHMATLDEKQLSLIFEVYTQKTALPEGEVDMSIFGDLVKKETGKTAQEYIQGKIIELSKEYILGSQLGISQIAYSLGFQYPQHFSRLFKKLEGCTPNEFRNQAMS